MIYQCQPPSSMPQAKMLAFMQVMLWMENCIQNSVQLTLCGPARFAVLGLGKNHGLHNCQDNIYAVWDRKELVTLVEFDNTGRVSDFLKYIKRPQSCMQKVWVSKMRSNNRYPISNLTWYGLLGKMGGMSRLCHHHTKQASCHAWLYF